MPNGSIQVWNEVNWNSPAAAEITSSARSSELRMNTPVSWSSVPLVVSMKTVRLSSP